MADFDPYKAPEEGRETNPYAAPEASLTPVSREYERPTGSYRLEPFSIDAVLRRAWEVFQSQMGLTIGIVFAVNAIAQAFQLIGRVGLEAMNQGAASPGAAFIFLGFFAIAMVLTLWLTLGQTVALLKLSRGEDATFGEVFQGGPYLLRFLGATILSMLLFLTIALVCAIPAGVAAAIAVNMDRNPIAIVFAVVLGFIGIGAFVALGTRLYQFPYVLVDRDCGAADSLQISYEITRGHVLELIALSILAGVIAMSGFLACFIGLIFTVPLSLLVQACTYTLLVGDRSRGIKRASADLEFLDQDFGS